MPDGWGVHGSSSLPIFYINLARRTDRRAFMQRQLAGLGLTAVRIEALGPDDLLALDRTRYCNPNRGHWMTETELACNMSHQAAWRRFLEGGSTRALILEDDAVLSSSLPAFLESVSAQALDIDVIRIETLGSQGLRFGAMERRLSPDVGLRQCFTRDAGAGAYLLSRRAATLLLAQPQLKTELVDALLFNPFNRLGRELSVRYCDPALAIQESCLGLADSEAVSDLAMSRLEKRRQAARRPVRKWIRKIESWFTYDARVALARLSQLGRTDIRRLAIRFRPD